MDRRLNWPLLALIFLLPLGTAAAAVAADQPKAMKVPLVQMGLGPTLEATRDKIVRLTKQAATDARLVIFPESAMAAPVGTPPAQVQAALDAVAKVAGDIPGATNPLRQKGYWLGTTPRFQPWMLAGVEAIDSER